MAGPVLSANNHPPALDSQCHHAHPPTFLNNNPSSSLAYPSSHPHHHQYYQPSHQIAPQPSRHPHPHPHPPSSSLPHYSHHPPHPSPQPPPQSGSHYHHYPPTTSLKPTLPGIASILAFAGQAHSFVNPSSPVASNRTQSSDPLAHAHPISAATLDHSTYHASHRSSICHAVITPVPPLNQRRRRSSSMTIVPADQRSTTHPLSVDHRQRSPPEFTADLPIASPPIIAAPHSIFSLSRSTPDQTNSDSFGDDRAPFLRPPPSRTDEPLQRRHSERLPPRRVIGQPESYPSPSLQPASSSSYDHTVPSPSSSALPHSSYHALARHPPWPSTTSSSSSLLQDSNHNTQHSLSSTSHQRRLSSPLSSSNESSHNPTTRPIIITSSALLATGPTNNRYQCPEHGCGKTFSRPSSLKIHTYSHTGQKPFKCLRCDRAFSVQSNLKRHQKVHERRIGKIGGGGSGNGRGKETSPMTASGGGTMGSAEEGDDESDMMDED